MKRVLVVAVLAACSRSSPSAPPAPKPAPKPAATTAPAATASPAAERHRHHEDRHDPAVAAPPLSLTVRVDGKAQVWSQDVFDRVPHFTSKNHDGDARETWSLRELAHVIAPDARVVAVVGATTAQIAPAAWTDPTHTPILHRTRRGALKFRWADGSGAWGETAVKDVTALEIQR